MRDRPVVPRLRPDRAEWPAAICSGPVRTTATLKGQTVNAAVMESAQAKDAADVASAKAASRKTLDQRIAEAADALAKLQDEKKRKDAQARADNEKAVRRLLTTEGLMVLDVETWRTALPAVKKALGVKAAA